LGPCLANAEPLAAPSPTASAVDLDFPGQPLLLVEAGSLRLLALALVAHRQQAALRQRQQTQATSLDEQQRLAREVEVYSGRLARCRQALDRQQAALILLML
jgi:hypothetical protein